VTASLERVESLIDALASFWEREREACEAQLSDLQASVRLIKGETGDRRLQALLARIEELGRRVRLLADMSRDDFLAKLREETQCLRSAGPARHLDVILSRALPQAAMPVEEYCAQLLDAVIEATEAERGFVALYSPESTEVEIAAARDYASRNLSLAEYRFSRGLLGGVLTRGEPVVVDDAVADPAYSQHGSVRELNLRSVLAGPIEGSGRVSGAIYVENRSRAGAFTSRELGLLTVAGRLAASYMHQFGLLADPPHRAAAVFLDSERAGDDIVGRAPEVRALRDEIRRIAPTDATVLIEGETGTGKELVAAALHSYSGRRDGPFVAINCAAIPENLVESELFGHDKGAFTGATQAHAGQVEMAEGGTLFLDEVNELPYGLQAKLLRLLQAGEYRRVGGSETRRADVRIVAATSRGLKQLVADGKFQNALFYRLYVIPLLVPALRDRRDDIPVLAEHFASRFAARYGKTVSFAPGVLAELQAYGFPGNVRELENLIHRLVVRSEGGWIRTHDLPAEVSPTGLARVSLGPASIAGLLETDPRDLADLEKRHEKLQRAMAEQKRALVERVAGECGGNLTEAARRLGLHRATIYKILGRDAHHN
jgi:Nif-specific regulatory protein